MNNTIWLMCGWGLGLIAVSFVVGYLLGARSSWKNAWYLLDVFGHAMRAATGTLLYASRELQDETRVRVLEEAKFLDKLTRILADTEPK